MTLLGANIQTENDNYIFIYDVWWSGKSQYCSLLHALLYLPFQGSRCKTMWNFTVYVVAGSSSLSGPFPVPMSEPLPILFHCRCPRLPPMSVSLFPSLISDPTSCPWPPTKEMQWMTWSTLYFLSTSLVIIDV